ncbi:uncharacterized protein C8R40DRAFT_1096485 [Lentinula edodes]|uniref:uncharacterized protein n=1 Tax=Lentinula edodes TaxID=5353 RepID=UPI001E8DB6E9|nr:uncharacterized protein C8R40DRAFT_1096485 [Lentinula edodes]KAH7876922.1 hypothetical protein C8R40DRAFT_1096485 [Lentinula edodes]
MTCACAEFSTRVEYCKIHSSRCVITPIPHNSNGLQLSFSIVHSFSGLNNNTSFESVAGNSHDGVSSDAGFRIDSESSFTSTISMQPFLNSPSQGTGFLSTETYGIFPMRRAVSGSLSDTRDAISSDHTSSTGDVKGSSSTH